tara:strand:+ start:2123 stop:2713 length:591 start_codon:yes stop_codon:yes gene_type:complete
VNNTLPQFRLHPEAVARGFVDSQGTGEKEVQHRFRLTNTLETFEEEIWPYIEKFFKKDSEVLDVGCGNGRFSWYLSHFVKEVTSFDPYDERYDSYKSDNIFFEKSDFQSYKTNKKYDVIFLFGVYYLWASDNDLSRDSINKMTSMLKEDGIIIMIDQSMHSDPPVETVCDKYQKVDCYLQKNGVHKINIIKKKQGE